MRALSLLFIAAAIWLCVSLAAAQDAPPPPQDAPPAQEAPPTIESLITKGDAALKASNWEEALQSYSAAIKMDASNYNILYKRAGLYLLRGRSKLALEDLNTVIELKPPASLAVQARLRRGKVLVSFGDVEGAKNDFNEVLKVKPDNDAAKTQLASLQKINVNLEAGRQAMDRGAYEEANRILTEALNVASDNKEGRLLRARAALELKDYHKMLEDTMSVLKQQSRNVEALYLRGKAFYHLGEREAAMKNYIEGLKYDPDNSACKGEFRRLNRLEKAMKQGDEKYNQNNFEEALSEYDVAITLEPDYKFVTPTLYLNKCKCYLKLKNIAKTLETCSKALEMDDSLVDAYINKAEAQMLAEDYDKAIHEWNKAREKQPQNGQINEGLQRAHRLQKMASRKDYYKILEVTKTATDAEIRKAFRKLSLTWHPDKHDEDKEVAEKKYVEITEAYEVLSNPEARARFDNGEDLNVQPNFGGGGFPFGHGGGGGGGPFHFSFNFGG